jgi:hypothetical protein
MMTPLPTPVQLQVAAMRMAGYAISANLRIMQDLTGFALSVPLIPVRALQASTAGAEKAPAKTQKSAATIMATTTPNVFEKSEVAAKPKATLKTNPKVTAKAKDKIKTATTAKTKIESKARATAQEKVEAQTTAKPKVEAKHNSRKEPSAPTKTLVAPKPRGVEKAPASVKPDVRSKPDAGKTAKPEEETSLKMTLQAAVDSTHSPHTASQTKPAVSQIAPNPVPKREVSSAKPADTTNPPRKARLPSNPPAMPSKPGNSKV